ncbi:MAG: carboxyvinyl-carboxyphosphonate phosphorylmutase [OM182 bacterium MED-G28]|uniref:Carboxyvinyl-carboxyphosphonate phosphorylmutase n=1 Tax=OM182 bacterium MED-G28 TaxID=1986256 RepID=A0A2A5W8Y7_9GAMM|nr:MAG: carboxyvinyl-carboxyphosphonate phosphorylmutase [OM182 bacterium MED-G28]
MLKSLLQTEKIILIPGTFDALSALIAKQSGFKALYMSGFGVAGSLLAKPDIGLVTASEMVERASQIVDAAEGIPLIADGDNGYGGIHNVSRLVKAYEKAGVQCIQLEDQVIPKRCGHMDNKEVVDLEEATAKIKAAIQSRNSKDFLIAARTDSRATHDLDEALRRGEAFLNAGADILFIEAPQSVDEMQRIKNEFPEANLIANIVEGGKTPELSIEELAKIGFKIVLRPVSALLAISGTLQDCYAALLNSNYDQKNSSKISFEEYNDMIGLATFE